MRTRKTIDIHRICLSYLEKNEVSTPTLFFVHGNSGSAASWQKQMESPQLSAYRLIAFDLPGHGRSTPIPANENILFKMAEVLACAVKELSNGGPFILVGLSLGTNLVAEMLTQDVQPAGIALLGSCILGSGHNLLNIGLEGADLTPLFSETASNEAIQACIKSACLSKDQSIHRQLLEDYQSTLPAMRPSFLQVGLLRQYSDEVALLKNAGLPLLIIFGRDEKLINPDYLSNAGLPLWQNEVFKVRGGSHFIHLDKPIEVNRLLQAYTQYVIEGNPAESQCSAIP